MEEIINADFSYNDEWISVSAIYGPNKSRLIKMYNHRLVLFYTINENLNEKTVVLSAKKPQGIVERKSEREKLWLFTCGKASEDDQTLYYSLYKLKDRVTKLFYCCLLTEN